MAFKFINVPNSDVISKHFSLLNFLHTGTCTHISGCEIYWKIRDISCLIWFWLWAKYRFYRLNLSLPFYAFIIVSNLGQFYSVISSMSNSGILVDDLHTD